MTKPLTESAKKIIHHAKETVWKRGLSAVGPEHLLLGLLAQKQSVALDALDDLGVSRDVLRSDVETRLDTEAASGKPLSLTPRSRRVLDLAENHADQLKHKFTGPEHLFLGLVQERDGLAGRMLARHGVALEAARQAVWNIVLGDDAVDMPSPQDIDENKAHREARYREDVVFATRAIHQRSTGIPRWILSAADAFFGVGTLYFIIMAISLQSSTPVLGVIVFALTWAVFRNAKVSQQEYEAALNLLGSNRPQYVLLYVRMLKWRDRKISNGARNALTQVLPLLPMNVAYKLRAADKATLAGYLAPYKARENAGFALAILKAFEAVGDVYIRKYVNTLAELRPRTEIDKTLCTAAKRCLAKIDERTGKVAERKTLLRASSAVPASPDELLRPASAAGQTHEAELLRPIENEQAE